MFEGLNIRGNALRFLEEYAVNPDLSVDTQIGQIKQSDRPLAHVDRLFGYDLILLLTELNNRGRFRMLDLPCGPKARAVREAIAGFPNADITGIDLIIDESSTHPRLTLMQDDIFAMPSLPGKIDLAISYGFLHYLREARRDDLTEQFLLKVSASLVPGGVALIDASWDHLRMSRNRFGRSIVRIVEQQLPVEISARSRKYPFGIRHPEFISLSNLFSGKRVDNDYIFITKLQ